MYCKASQIYKRNCSTGYTKGKAHAGIYSIQEKYDFDLIERRKHINIKYKYIFQKY
jgi:hypothetical protein